MNELCAAVNHQLPGVVGHPDVRKRLFNHLVNGCSRDGQVVVVSRRSHRGKHMTTNSKETVESYGLIPTFTNYKTSTTAP